MYTYYLPNSGPPMLDDEEYLSAKRESKQGSEDEGYENDSDEEEEDENYFLNEKKENYDMKVLKEIRILYKDDDEENDFERMNGSEDDDYEDYEYESSPYIKPLSTVKTNY